MKRIILILTFISLIQVINGQTRVDTLLSQLKDTNSEKVFVVSHRGDWRNAPENSLQAIQNCIDMGVDMVEVDLKKTKDGEIILMHDKKIDRTMTGKGAPEEYTLAELRKMNLRNGAGHATDHKVATLRDAMTLAKGRILVNIDKGYDYFDDVYKILEETGTLNQCVIKAGKKYEEVKEEKPVALDKMIFMPVIKLSKENAEKRVKGFDRNYKPMMYELVFDNDSKETLNKIHYTKKTGSRIFINSLWPELCGGHHDDRAVEKGEVEKSWGWIIKCGASLIQTDRPAQLLTYLRSRGLHE